MPHCMADKDSIDPLYAIPVTTPKIRGSRRSRNTSTAVGPPPTSVSTTSTDTSTSPLRTKTKTTQTASRTAWRKSDGSRQDGASARRGAVGSGHSFQTRWIRRRQWKNSPHCLRRRSIAGGITPCGSTPKKRGTNRKRDRGAARPSHPKKQNSPYSQLSSLQLLKKEVGTGRTNNAGGGLQTNRTGLNIASEVEGVVHSTTP